MVAELRDEEEEVWGSRGLAPHGQPEGQGAINKKLQGGQVHEPLVDREHGPVLGLLAELPTEPMLIDKRADEQGLLQHDDTKEDAQQHHNVSDVEAHGRVVLDWMARQQNAVHVLKPV
jgi:hypothetical protein